MGRRDVFKAYAGVRAVVERAANPSRGRVWRQTSSRPARLERLVADCTRAGVRDACHAAMSDARHATARLPIFTGDGNRPAAISRYMDDVALKPVRDFSSGRRMNCSGTDMLPDIDALCSRATGEHTQGVANGLM